MGANASTSSSPDEHRKRRLVRASDLGRGPENDQIDPFDDEESFTPPRMEGDQDTDDSDDGEDAHIHVNQSRAEFFERERRIVERDSDEGEDLFGEHMER
ncbi:hypothetical protein DI09_54p120 [Mitosporidium daphniae]|uniref:Uncharacterized protein n=1 Tax=Mitosporidium daphniae TaxID=1485682 RepID=A0A098VPD4_9MICR|nr:uncharacterized protein DI09_54p120 [Mitosporidium daphniae]KGG50820.1 hypothetical protein DI09_54p120 [Mitosporidium daphniae]|eukprot:XP_013237247.1 uncharacterized protein DI09_54p120 [Mitosporidium daphniae]